MWGHWTRFPHDLEHYSVEAILRPKYGFWELASRQAPFATLEPSRPWPRAKRDWYARVVRRHGEDMLIAEMIGGLPRDGASIEQQWREARGMLKREWGRSPDNPLPDLTRTDYEKIVDLGRRLRRDWDRLPAGGALSVEWPPGGDGDGRRITPATRRIQPASR